jgi:RNA ligase (TIGR02306 family)
MTRKEKERVLMRKLASVQIVKEINPIEGADQIERLTVLGWQLVAKKGDFQVGNRCVYIEIDSVLPDKPEFEFMRDRKFRVKTIRLKGQISQGIAFPMSILPAVDYDFYEGQDVTELLEITKWEPIVPIHLGGKVKGKFPSFLAKTDETRVQVLQDVLTRNKGILCYESEKLDGTSSTFYVRDGEFGVCSRNLELCRDGESNDRKLNVYWEVAQKYNIEEKLKSLRCNIAIQGEIVGQGIQKNYLGLKDRQVFFFNVFDIDKYQYLDYVDFINKIGALGLETVPILRVGVELDDFIDGMVAKAMVKSVINPNVWAEGYVIRPLVEKIDLQMAQALGNGRLSFKCVNPEYLLKYGG